MKTLTREKAKLEWEKFWNELKDEWFKVEVLQDYSVEDMGESLQAWLEGKSDKAIEILMRDAENSEWVKMCKSSPAKKIRVHIVKEPYTPYLSWEMEYYKRVNALLAGEKIYIVNRDEVENLDIPDGDFMIFDNKRVMRNYYTPEGKMYKADFYYESDDVGKFLDLKDKIFTKAQSLE